MSQIIAGVYEIYRQIGAGGGGIVYLGQHIRLQKKVVLKADKRKLSAKTESLRREVDMLKNLNHTYIPQVYDFVEEDGIVYTVMDYIEGESFDKILAKEKKISQPEIVKWACQLLEALCYLHSQPPYGILHGDIKPANIMLRPDGNICLIDYNIALALGEDGAVKVGFSQGYASPEHYGADYIKSNRAAAVRKITSIQTGRTAETADKAAESADGEATLVLSREEPDGEATQVLSPEELSGGIPQSDGRGLSGSPESSGTGSRSSGSSAGTEGRKAVMLDVRSDIYSLGATLYHIISGKRPAKDAREVQPLGTEVCSPAIAAIIQKAMNPQPDMRYQSAEEMLYAFRQLHRNDLRMVRHRRRELITAAGLTALFLAGGASAFIGLNQLKQRQNALALSEYSANALANGDVAEAINLALQAIPEEGNILAAPVTAQAQKALTDALGVYDLSDGYKASGTYNLPSAPFDIAVSPEGTRFAVVYAYEAVVYDMESNQEIVTLPTQVSALADIVFVDENTIIYAGKDGVTSFDLEGRKENWKVNAATTLSLSGDKSRLAAVDRNRDYAVVYQVSDGRKIAECSFQGEHLSVPANDVFADAKDSIFTLNYDGSKLAVSFSNGGLNIFDVGNSEDTLILYEESDFAHFEGGFRGQYFAFAANRNGQSVFGLIDIDKGEYLGGYESQDPFRLKTDESGIYLAKNNLLVDFDPVELEETELAYTDNVNITGFSVGEGYALVATDDNCASFYDRGANRMSTESCTENCDFVELFGKYAVLANRNEPSVRMLSLEKHEDEQLLSYDVGFEHDEARISVDGQTAMLFNYRQFAVYDREGQLVMQEELPDADYIYDQQFIKEAGESWLEVTWYDGTVRCYDAKDGSLVSKRQIEPPSKDLYEEFDTDRYKIASPLHSAAEVYDSKTGQFIGFLEKDSYLTYVTQTGDYLVTEYVSAAGERYGLLLDRDLQTLAYLPHLCDITDRYLVFDYDSGNLRQCPLYSMEELIGLGEAYLAEE